MVEAFDVHLQDLIWILKSGRLVLKSHHPLVKFKVEPRTCVWTPIFLLEPAIKLGSMLGFKNLTLLLHLKSPKIMGLPGFPAFPTP
jgi:hypothetical protein